MAEIAERLKRLPEPERERFIRSLSPAESLALLAEIDPCDFAEKVFGITLYPKQRAMVEAVFLKQSRRVSCVGSNSSGKDMVSGRVVIPMWLFLNRPGKVVVIAPTHRQVESIVWNEVRTAIESAKALGYTFPGDVGKLPRWEISPEHFAIGFATDNPMNIQGFHSPNLLVIISEAHNVEQAHIDALKRLGPKCTLMTGNPFCEQGEFYDSHHDQADLWERVHILATDTPNIVAGKVVIPGLVTQQDLDDRAAEWGEDSPLYRQFTGEWVDMSDMGVVPLQWLRAAAQRERIVDPTWRTVPLPTKILGVDVARFGTDKTTVMCRDGEVAELLWRVQGKDTQEVAGWVWQYIQEHREGGTVVVDDTGVGGGVTDRLRENLRAVRLPWKVMAFNAGEKARDPDRFQNAIAECWWLVREWLEPSRGSKAVIPDDAALMGQGAGRKYKLDGRGRIGLESKDDMAKRGRHSPDEFDALAMTFAVLHLGDIESRMGVYLGGQRPEVRPVYHERVHRIEGVLLKAKAKHRYTHGPTLYLFDGGMERDVPRDVARVLLQAHPDKFEIAEGSLEEPEAEPARTPAEQRIAAKRP
jgi:hypothetical protein